MDLNINFSTEKGAQKASEWSCTKLKCIYQWVDKVRPSPLDVLNGVEHVDSAVFPHLLKEHRHGAVQPALTCAVHAVHQHRTSLCPRVNLRQERTCHWPMCKKQTLNFAGARTTQKMPIHHLSADHWEHSARMHACALTSSMLGFGEIYVLLFFPKAWQKGVARTCQSSTSSVSWMKPSRDHGTFSYIRQESNWNCFTCKNNRRKVTFHIFPSAMNLASWMSLFTSQIGVLRLQVCWHTSLAGSDGCSADVTLKRLTMTCSLSVTCVMLTKKGSYLCWPRRAGQ